MAQNFDWFFKESSRPEASSRSNQDWFFKDRLPAAEPEKDNGFWGKDTLANFGIGGNQLLDAIGTTYGLISGNMDNAATRLADSNIEFYQGMLSDEYQQKDSDYQQYVNEADGLANTIGRSVTGLVKDPDLMFGFLVRQVPMAIGGLGGGALVGYGLKATSVGAKTVAAGTVAGNVAGNVALNVGDVSGDVYQSTVSLPIEILEADEEFVLRRAEAGEQVAREELALTAARNAGLATAALTSLTGLLPGTLERNIGPMLPGNAKDSLLTRFGKGFAGEAFQESIEEGGGQFIGNVAKAQINPNQDLLEGVGQGIGQGGFLGGIIGGGTNVIPRSNLGNEIKRGQQQAAEQGGDGLDQAKQASGNAAATPIYNEASALERQRERMGLNTNPEIQVDGNAATYNGPSGTTTIEMDTAEQSVNAAQQFQQQAEQRSAPVVPKREGLQPIGTSTNDPLQRILDTILLNDRDIRNAENSGDVESANALNEDNVRLRSVERQLRRANQLAQSGDAVDRESAERIIARVTPVLQEEAGRRAAFDMPVVEPVQPEPLRLEDAGIIYAGAPDTRRPTRVTRLKNSGDAYPTQRSATIALNRTAKSEPSYDWSIIKSGDGFALEGRLPEGERATSISEITPDTVIDAAQTRMNETAGLELYVDEMQPLPDAIETFGTTIGEQINVLQSNADEFTQRLISVQNKLNDLNARDQKGVLSDNPAATIKDTDDLLLTIVKLGGINIEDASSNGFEPKYDNPKPNSVGKYRLFKKDGKTFDELREGLQERGWYNQEDPNRPAALSANEVMEDIRDAVNLAGDGQYVYQGDKQSDIGYLENEANLTEEMIEEFEGLVAAYQSETGPDMTRIPDEVMLDRIDYFQEVGREFYEERAQLQETFETYSRDVASVESGRNTRAQGIDSLGERRDERAEPVGGEESFGAQRDRVRRQEELERNDLDSSDFELSTYTEEDIQRLEDRDLEAAEQRDQIDRERENFSLDTSAGGITSGSDATQTEQNSDMFGVSGREDSDPDFSARRAGRVVRGVSDEKLSAVIKRVTGQDRDNNDRVIVAPTFNDLPQELRDAAKADGHKSGSVNGVFHKGSIYVVGENLNGQRELEEVLLHEGTHGGLKAILGDGKVKSSLAKLYSSMGGREGFEKTLKDLGVDTEVAYYKEALAEGMPEARRNEILVEEMIAFTGQKGSKGIKLRVQEVIGAIRNWLRKNGFARLASINATDIAALAKRSRETFFAQGQSENGTAFSVKPEKVKPKTTRLNLYSNAEKVLLDEGDKIFKPSKKNPEGSVRGDQIMSFLKGRGVKKDEMVFTELEDFLTDTQRGIGVPRYTKEEVINYLRNRAPDLSEQSDEGFSQDSELDFDWMESEPLEDTDYYEHLWEDGMEEARRGDFDYRSAQALENLIFDYPISFGGMIVEPFLGRAAHTGKVLKGEDDVAKRSSAKKLALAAIAHQEASGESLIDLVFKEYESEFEDAMWEAAKAEYMDNPVTETRLVLPTDVDLDVVITGSEDVGFTVKIDGEYMMEGNRVGGLGNAQFPKSWFNLDEAKINAVNEVVDQGLIDPAQGDTRYFDYLNIDRESINNYREVKIVLENNAMSFEGRSYTGGHFDMDNMLYHQLLTDRDFDGDDALVLEEMQSDWHSDIRKRGGPRDPDFEQGLRDQSYPLTEESKEIESSIMGIVKTLYENHSTEGLPKDMQAGPSGRGNFYSRVLDYGRIIQDVEPYFSQKGLDKIKELSREAGPQVVSDYSVDNNSVDDLQAVVKFRSKFRDFFTSPMPEAGPSASEFSEREIAETTSFYSDEVQENIRLLNTRVDLIPDEARVPSNLSAVSTLLSSYAELSSMFDGVQVGDKSGRELAAEAFDKDMENQKVVRSAAELLRRADSNMSAPPDSPFRDDRYLELGAKRALITAIEENKDVLAYSTGSRVSRRWSQRIDYEAIYDKKLKKIMDKLMKQKGVAVDENGQESVFEEFYRYEITDELREQVRYEGLPMFSARPEAGRIYLKRSAETKMSDRFIQGLQDKFLPIKRLQQGILEAGGNIIEKIDAYLAEEMFYGKTEEDLRQIELEFVAPLMDDLEKSKVSVEELDNYLMAKHAKERNDHIASINEAMPDGGSGLSNADAQAYLDKVASDPSKQKDLDRLSSRVYEMTELTRNLLVNGGLASEEQVSSWNSMFDFYVPLKGYASDEKNADGFPIRTGKGYEISGKESRRALGRRSKAASPLVQVIADLTEKTIRNRKNEVGIAFLGMAEANPDPTYWEIFTEDNPDTKDKWNGQSGRVSNDQKMTALEMSQSPDYLGVKRNGKQYFIKIRDQRVMDAMRKVGPQAQGMITRIMGSATRWLSFVNTAGDPDFVVANFTRDIQSAFLNILAEETKAGGRLENVESVAKDAVSLKNVGKSIAAIAEFHRKNKKAADPDNEYQVYYQEFVEAGGKTGFFDTPDLDSIARNLNSKLEDAGALKKVKDIGESVVDFVTDYNTAVENGVRLSTYIAARKAGLTVKKAASLSKNLTVNFNRKGDYGHIINSTYMFFNAAVQGTTQWAVTMSPFTVDSQGDWKFQRNLNLAQKVAAGMVVSGSMVAALGRMVGGEDDDGEAYWDKINPSVRERNLIFMRPGYKEVGDDGFLSDVAYYKLPLPYGYNFFYNLGDAIEGMANAGERRKPKLLGQVVESFLTAFSPFSIHAADSVGERLFISATPSVLLPGAELATNTNFFGGDIIRPKNPYGAERSSAHNYYSTTKAPYVNIAKFMNDTVGGGSEYKSGSVDPMGFLFDTKLSNISTDFSPDALEHLLEYSLGGIYRTSARTVDAAQRYFSDRQVSPASLPFLNKVMGRDGSDFADRSNYYEVKQLIENARTDFKNTKGADRSKAVKAHDGLHMLYRQMLNTDKKLSRFRDQQDRARDNSNLTPSQVDEKVEQIRIRMDSEIDDFYSRYKRHMEKRAGS